MWRERSPPALLHCWRECTGLAKKSFGFFSITSYGKIEMNFLVNPVVYAILNLMDEFIISLSI